MTTKHFLTMASLAIAGLFTFSSCDDDEAEYHAPVYKTITFSPNPCYPGDKVTATVSYSKKGENWYYYMQRFTLDGNVVLVRNKGISPNVVMPDPPTCTFDAPAAGTHTFKFTCGPSCTVGSTLYPENIEITAELVVTNPNNNEGDNGGEE